ncbi:MAG: hypothetical protein HYU51_18260 [Candidatus Rokubacteria bacterium]|nr:hypothetical protein [Candidatus Rokubacteria bacterium]
MSRERRIVITVCPRERGVVTLPIERGGRRVRLDAAAIAHALATIAGRRGLRDRVRVESGCAGRCSGPGPNVSLAFHAVPGPGEPSDNVALGWRSYAASLGTLACLAQVIDDNVEDDRSGGDCGVREPVNESGGRGAPRVARVRPRTPRALRASGGSA